jgi:fructose-1,6-bisphosphatase/inositol monophosphatase family enzyme
MVPDIERVAALIREVAAEEITPRFNALAAEDVREKRPGNLVTTADLAAEKRLIDGLTALAPGSTVVAEEMFEADPGIVARLSGEAAVWVIDPVDGTANFAAGRAVFACMVALVEKGRVVAGWILDVPKGVMAEAEEGSGAFAGGARLAVAPPAPLPDMTGSLGARLRNDPAVRDRVGPIRYVRCAGIEHIALAAGELHYAFFRRVMPWDHAAGSLLHREAGGCNLSFSGDPYAPAAPPEQGLLLAPDRDSWRALHGVIAAALAR